MQASIHTFAEDGSGSALLDDGHLVSWPAEVFAGSALRHVRPGQRVSVELDDGVGDGDGDGADGADGADRARGARVTRLWIVGIGEGETIR